MHYVSSSPEVLNRWLVAHPQLQTLNISRGTWRGTSDDLLAQGKQLTDPTESALPNFKITGGDGHRHRPITKEMGVSEAAPGTSAGELEQSA